MSALERPPLCAALPIWEAWLVELQVRQSTTPTTDASLVFETRHAQAVIECKKAAPAQDQTPPGP